MNKNSNTYIIIYSTVMVVVVATLLAVAALALQGRQQANIRVEKQSAILASIGLGGGAEKAKDKTVYIRDEYKKYIVESFAVNGLGEKVEGADAFGLLGDLKAQFAASPEAREIPVFVARLDDGTRLYFLPVYGAGLWGPIWGYLAIEKDWNTIYGVKFDHKGETPGLGAEITTQWFADQFKGKKIFDLQDKFVGIAVLKGSGSSVGNDYAVDAVSGGTITSRGVEKMIYDCLNAYMPYIEKQRAAYEASVSTGVQDNNDVNE